MPADQGGQHGQPLLRRGQLGRVDVDRGGVGGDVARDVGDQVGRLGDPRGERAELGVGVGGLLQRAAGGGEQPEGVPRLQVVGAGERLGGRGRRPRAARPRRRAAGSARAARRPRRAAARRPRPRRAPAAAARPRAAARRPRRSAARACARTSRQRAHSSAKRCRGLEHRRRRRSGRAPPAGGPAAAAAAGRSARARRPAARTARRARPTGTPRPPRCARERPSADTVRDTSSTSSSSSPPASSARSPPGGRPAAPAAPRPRRAAAPGRTRPASARPPNSRLSPCTTIVLPAPVSPVTTVSPGASSSTASSMTPRPRMRISSSTSATVRPTSDSPGLAPEPVERLSGCGAPPRRASPRRAARTCAPACR